MSTVNLLGKKIRHLRKSKNISQETLSEMAEISPRQMIRIELGQSLPTLENLEKIALALNVTVQSLFDNDYYADVNTLKNKLYKNVIFTFETIPHPSLRDTFPQGKALKNTI